MVRPHTVAALLGSMFSGTALAQSQPIAHLPFNWTITGGTRAQDYPPAQDAFDIWAVEDFVTDRAWILESFECEGTGYTGSPRPVGTIIPMDVVVRIYDAPPPEGNIVAHSVEGSGTCTVRVGPNGGELFSTTFNRPTLPPGNYYVVWQTTQLPSVGPTIMWATPGPYALGQGTPNSSWRFFPNQDTHLVLIGTNVDGSGPPIGTNFKLVGSPAGCPADLDGDQGVTVDDLVLFLQFFAEGDTRADLDNGSGTGTPDQGVTIDDLTFFLQHLIDGC